MIDFCTVPHQDRVFVRHVSSQLLYNADSKNSVRFKAVLLIVYTPLMTVIRSVAHLLSAVGDLGKKILNPKLTWQPFLESLIDIFFSVVYGIAMTGCAAVGIIAPYHGRHYYSMLESKLNREVNRTYRKDKLYFATCFHPLKNSQIPVV